MSNSMKLLALLDEEFGCGDIADSRYKKVSEKYHSNTNEHVVLIEYRVKRRENSGFGYKRNQADRRLLPSVNQLAKQK